MKRTQTERNTSFVGNGQLGTIQTAAMTVGDTVHPLISIGSEIGNLAGEDPRKRITHQSIAIDADGGAGSLLLTLTRHCVDESGAALASGETINVEGVVETLTGAGVIAHAFSGADYSTLHDLIVGINALPGFICFIGDGLTTHNTNTSMFIDLAITTLPNASADLLDTLYRDVSVDDLAYVRIGMPRKFDMAPMQIIGLSGSITSAAGAYGTLVTDNMSEYRADGSHQESAVEFTPVAVATAAITEHVDDNVLNAGDYRGSLVLVVTATDTAGASYKVKYKQVLGTHRNM